MAWNLKGVLLGACSCDWGCPCSFNARPTQGFCQGGYVWHIRQGEYDGVDLSGLTFCWMGKFPGPLHEGNGTSGLIITDKATPEQRRAINELASGKRGGPFAVFASVTAKFLDPVYAPFEVKVDGLHSRVRAGSYMDMELSPIENPVTGAREQLQLQKPTGFTSTWADLGMTRKFFIALPEVSYDHTGKYAEYSEFAYVEAAYAAAR